MKKKWIGDWWLLSIGLLIFVLVVIHSQVLVVGFSNNMMGIELIQLVNLDNKLPLLNMQCLPDEKQSLSVSLGGRLMDSASSGIASAVMLWVNGKCDLAREKLRSYVEIHPNNSIGWFWLGLADAVRGDFESAGEAIKTARAEKYIVELAVRANDSNDRFQTHFWLTVAAKTGKAFSFVNAAAQRYLSVGRRRDAVAIMQQFSEGLSPNTVESYKALGSLERVRGNPQSAARYFETALLMRADDTDLLDQLRTALMDAGDYKRALEIAEYNAKLASDQGQADLTVAWIYRLLGDYENASRWAIRTQKARPVWWATYNELGTIYCLQSQRELALSEFEKALSLSPKQIEVRIAQAKCLYRLGDTDLAIGYAEKIIESEGNDPRLIDFYLSLGEWYTQLGDIPKAQKLFQHGIQLWPDAQWQSRLQSN